MLVDILALLAVFAPPIVQGGVSETFRIVVERQKVEGGLVIGSISVDGRAIGSAYENADLKIPAGTYAGALRYWSGHNFVAGPFGTIGKEGDFLLEVTGVTGRRDILFHGGNKPQHSTGCIMLGPVGKDPATSIPSLDADHPLRKLRLLFYGTDTPSSTPNKRIEIEIRDLI
ncbi:MAG: hypothetical protein IT175_02255 [Acidobacteria bacterium]|nr:hypothetical protein [Acidobacteriota bacterium]